jgi:hypothetical protein
MKNLIASFGSLLFVSGAIPLFAQELPTLTAPAKGDTMNMSVQNGTRSSLSFGSSTSFGASVNLTSTEGTSTSASSSLAPDAGASLNFSIGAGPAAGTTSVNIDNLRTQGTAPANGSDTNGGTQESTMSSGVAELTGVQSQLNLTLDSARTGFTARSNTLHSSYGAIAGQDGQQLGTGSQNSSASGAATVNSNTNVDINSTTFTSVFMQAF